MKKYLPFLLGILLFGGLLYAVLTAKRPPRPLDERVTMKEKDKVPYGFYVARRLLPEVFPGANIFSDNHSPGIWPDIDTNGTGQAIFLIGRMFQPDRTEMNKIARFIRRGNYVFIITQMYGHVFRDVIGISGGTGFVNLGKDSLTLSLEAPRFKPATYTYPGKRFNGYFSGVDTSQVIVLGRDANSQPDFIQLRMGEGGLFINLAPPAFSNYFILYKNNAEYFSKAVSVIPSTVSTVVWNEYFNSKKPKEKKPNWLGVLWRYPSMRWALMTGLIAIILYLILEMRRRQRYIPFVEKPKNESLDFVQTVGRLYFDKKDHQDLALKMGSHFLDHVREKYRVSTELLDMEFINTLHTKTGYPQREIFDIVEFIKYTRETGTVKEQQLARFHEQLESFYKTN